MDLVVKPPDLMNKDPWLLNAANGTVDLRTGEIKPHNRDDLINMMIPIAYDPNACAPRFTEFVKEVTGENKTEKAPVAEFFQRWFGYSATGDVREDKLSVHWGDGGNGKSTLLGAVAGALGPYASTATPGLLIGGGGDEHPTKIANLWGKRMVTAYESGEDGQLKEESVKRMTGRDRLKGRFLYKEYFEFEPTHKLQMCTNYKPTVKGSDFGIWRRIILIPYLMSWGDEKEVSSRRAKLLKDSALPQKLLTEGEGILAWVIDGAKQWYKGGLNPPSAVVAAGDAYMSEQDRVGQFIGEECERKVAGWTPLNCLIEKTNHYGDTKQIRVGLYPAYDEWCKANGYFKLGKGRFQDAVERKVVGRWESRFLTKHVKNRREVIGFLGLSLIDDDLVW